jgi:hypothetical protein
MSGLAKAESSSSRFDPVADASPSLPDLLGAARGVLRESPELAGHVCAVIAYAHGGKLSIQLHAEQPSLHALVSWAQWVGGVIVAHKVPPPDAGEDPRIQEIWCTVSAAYLGVQVEAFAHVPDHAPNPAPF